MEPGDQSQFHAQADSGCEARANERISDLTAAALSRLLIQRSSRDVVNDATYDSEPIPSQFSTRSTLVSTDWSQASSDIPSQEGTITPRHERRRQLAKERAKEKRRVNRQAEREERREEKVKTSIPSEESFNDSVYSRSISASSTFYTLASDAIYSRLDITQPSNLMNPQDMAIRIVCLEPGLESDCVECSMFVTSLFKKPEFKALSYVWGTPSAPHPVINVNGSKFTITHSLHTALIQLRNPRAPVLLWVDAICIDQNNSLEKGHQVQHMPRIYGASDEVIAWLGDASSNSDAAMEYIARSEHTIKQNQLDEASPDVRAGLADLWSRSYWSRVWVVQELASAFRLKRQCYFRCGKRVVALQVFWDFLKAFLEKSHIKRGDHVLRPKDLISLSTSGVHKPFLDILWESALLQSSDIRDRIYGIRGISPIYYQDKIQVDYAPDFRWQSLCRKVMEYHIKREHDLDILCYFIGFKDTIDNSSPPNSQSPSWLRDLSARDSGMPPNLYSASKRSEAAVRISGNILRAHGVVISRIEQVKGPYRIEPPTTHHGPLLDWDADEADLDFELDARLPKLEDLEDLSFRIFQQRYPDKDDSFRENAFMEMVAGNNRHELDASACRRLRRARIAYEQNTYLGQWRADEDEQFRFIYERLIGRSLFTTVDGQIGLGPADTREGDWVCILFGSKLCTILRKKDKNHQFVGSAYIDGGMAGEYMHLAEQKEFHIR